MFIQIINSKSLKYPSTFKFSSGQQQKYLLSWKQARYLLEKYYKENAF